ncbi:MAG: ABC transporter ATP-binding protein [Chlamydiae bacterium]|nr:ABC transporter ATP-binding protein [Chlamydiota bacterium]
MKPVLAVENLKVTFSSHGKKIHAVSDISFTLHEGETLGVVGESGCGKSVTAKAITKLLPSFTSSFSGQVVFKEHDLLSLSEHQLQSIRGKEIGMVFQDPMTSLNPTLKVGTQIIEGYRKHHPQSFSLFARSAMIQYAIEMLKKVGIPNPEARVNEYAHTLSGGMRQRVMIAIALACKPRILIADEPTTALDVTIQAQILSLIKSIQQQEQTSILMITHDLSVIAGMCDRVIVMYAGKVVESANVDDLFYNPKHPYTQKLLQALPKIHGSKDIPLHSIDGNPPHMNQIIEGCAFAPRCPYAMRICREKAPEKSYFSPNHYSFCWLHKK